MNRTMQIKLTTLGINENTRYKYWRCVSHNAGMYTNVILQHDADKQKLETLFDTVERSEHTLPGYRLYRIALDPKPEL